MAEYIEREYLLHRFNIDDMMNVNGTLISLNDARNVISSVPAADVAPVRRARWNRPYLKWPWALFKIKNPYCFCTNCICAVKAKKITKYCPECGAQMDGAERLK